MVPCPAAHILFRGQEYSQSTFVNKAKEKDAISNCNIKDTLLFAKEGYLLTWNRQTVRLMTVLLRTNYRCLLTSL